MQLEREMADAYVQGDAKTLERIFADNLTTTSDSWKISTKVDNLKHIQRIKGATVELSEMEAGLTRDGSGAIVNGVAAFKNGDQERAYRFADGFAKRQNRWQLISSDHRELKALNVQACSQQSSIESSSMNVLTIVRFSNASSQPIGISSLHSPGNRESSEKNKKTLSPGQSANLHTSVKKPFLVTDLSGKCLGMYQPTEEPSLAVIR
jgi:uncharacterized protein YchJ